MNQCPKCGADFTSGAKFCEKCGCNLQTPYRPPKSSLETVRYWLLFGSIGFLAVFVFFVRTFIILPNHNKIIAEYKREIEQERPFTAPKIEMVFVEGGTYTMGSTDNIDERMKKYPVYYRSKPAHEVTVSSFYIGKYEITQAQWKAVMGTTIKQMRVNTIDYIYDKGEFGEGGNYPMYYVNWNDIQEFLRRLNAGTSKKYRLPTEAEWEYAARGGSKSQGYKYCGSNDLDNVAWYNHNSGGSSHPVGTKQPNELGIYDMSGNVREWCNDFSSGDAYPYPSSPQRDPTGPSSGNKRAIRNCGWCNHEYVNRVFFRFAIVPDWRDKLTGFRVVLSDNSIIE